jgi:hypothetical protein
VTGQIVADYLNSIYQSSPEATTDVQEIAAASGQKTSVIITQINADVSSALPGLMVIGQGGEVNKTGSYNLVSDSDGIVCALDVAARLLEMKKAGSYFNRNATIATHIRTADGDMQMNDDLDVLISQTQTSGRVFDGILTVRSVKSNSLTSFRGFCITPTIKEGWILPMSGDLFKLAGETSGEVPKMLSITMYDIMRGSNNASPRINNLLTPNITTDRPVVGIGIATQTKSPEFRANASHFSDIEEASRFIIEAILAFDKDELKLYDSEMFTRAKTRYSSIDMSTLQRISI